MSNEEDQEGSIGLEVPLASIGGALYGLFGVYLKKTMGLIEGGNFNPASGAHWGTILSSSVFWIAVIVGILGLVAWVVGLHVGRVSIVGPIVGGFMVFVPVICGFFGIIIPQEEITTKKVIGILAITVGSMGLAAKGE